jgi:DNA-entry nuclease
VLGFASVEGIPDYSGKAYVELNGNIPEFTEAEKVTKSYEKYAELDSLGRCGVTVACVGKDIMPTEDRESISSVKPTGWINNKYDTDLVDGGYIYNRCHLIGFQLTGENANKNNLITGTRYLNIEGMLPFENMVADYVKETGNHVMYRVTPIFVGKNLLASGVKIGGWSVEDNGDGICFNVFAYNVQPGISINYATGDNALNGEADFPTDTESNAEESATAQESTYILNTSSQKIHKPTCAYAKNIAEHNRQEYTGSIDGLLAEGYTACGTCKP